MKVIVACMLVVMGAHAQSSLDTAARFDVSGPRVLCGPVLADAMAMFCLDSDDGVQKRSLMIHKIGSLLPHDKQQKLLRAWFAQRSRALAMSRGKRDPGLVDECCLKPCYVSEILNYC